MKLNPYALSRFVCALAGSLLLSFLVVGGSQTAAAETERNAEFVCGTKIVGGAFFSETGRMVCADELGDVEKDVKKSEPNKSGEQEIFCFYNASCAAVTENIREALLIRARDLTGNSKSDWRDLDDDTLNQTVMSFVNPVMMMAMRNNVAIPFDIAEFSVQCVGTMKPGGKPNCPSVNHCVNRKKNVSKYWRIQPLDPQMYPRPTDSRGFRMRERGDSVPKPIEGTKR